MRGFGELCDQRKYKLAIIFDVPNERYGAVDA
jgi:hypothetical protein